MTLSPLERLERLRQGLKSSNAGGDRAYYSFWTMAAGQYAILRFLPDKKEDNPYPWVEKLTFNWKFADPDNPGQEVSIKAPCQETWDGNKTCPVLNELRALFKTKDPEDEKMARSYWPKRSFLYQGFVRKSPLSETPPENPIRLFALNKQIHGKIHDAVVETDPALAIFKDAGPDDFANGRDFIVKKVQGPMYTDWGSSSFAQTSSPLTEEELAAIKKFGLNDLMEKLGQRPSDAAFAVLKQMFEAHISGNPWDKAWEVHWKPQRQKGDEKSARDDGDDGEGQSPQATSSVKSDVLAKIRGGASAAKATVEAASVAEVKPTMASIATAPAAAKSGESAIERLRKSREAAAAKAS